MGVSYAPSVVVRSGAERATLVRRTYGLVFLSVPVTMLGRIPAGTLFYPESFREDLAALLSVTPDPVTGVPYGKQQNVSVEKIPLTPTLSPETERYANSTSIRSVPQKW